MAVAKVASYRIGPPAFCHWTQEDNKLRMPLKSWPNGATPPAERGVMVSGGNPSVRDAAPGVIVICDAVGMVFFAPLFANGTGSLDGMPDRSMQATSN
nr:hypothetical protein [uncultured Lichenicoccus sp.]